ncbi:E3 ubiquitin/ISG15 ligase TRIM25-like [Trichomycterus rosablanca]|uniref:E3 ubiquitin/ISG15 ligase TRIM25-like n=1 Tax=Trichomycterus rosablanca TaxID=2290929 RepID=UPI002F35774B
MMMRPIKITGSKISVAQDEFSCSVCLKTLKDPVTTSCGHSFCMVCINNCWDQEDNKGTYSCPQCRKTFTSRPEVSRNAMLAGVVEKLKKTELQAPHPGHCSAGPEDVECDFCTERKSKAVKSCLVCLASFCETHLQPHYQIPVYKNHKLVEAFRRLQDQICSQHNKLLEVYCRTDQQCICILCMLDNHKTHDTISAAAERTEKQKQLLEIQKKIQEKIQNREKELCELINVVESHKCSAQTAVENIELICTELINSINRRCSELKDLIRDRETAEVSQAENNLKQVEQQIVELKRKDAELEQLSHTEDPVHFLQNFQSLLAPAGSAESAAITIGPYLSFDDVTKSASQLREKVEEFWKDQCEKIPDEVIKVRITSPPEPEIREDFLHLKKVRITSPPEPEIREDFLHLKKVRITSPPEPEIREDFLQYVCRFTLDSNTVNKNLHLSEENKVVTCSGTQSYTDHPERFDSYWQVLCRESVSGRCYWEVEWSGDYCVYIAVSYKSISRKGRGGEGEFGCNDQSWSLFCSPSRFLFLHKKKKTKISIMPSSSRIGVYVDYKAGTLSFYSVSDTMKLLHRVQTTFTQLLYPGFHLYSGSKVKLSDLTY